MKSKIHNYQFKIKITMSKTTKLVLAIAMNVFSYTAIVAQEQVQTKEQVENKPVYTCSMHPEVVSDQPGDCPKCGMKLIEKKEKLTVI